MLLDLTARVLLAPVLIGQAFFVRASVRKLPEAAGPRSGVTGDGPDLRLLVLGDSSGAGVGAKTQAEALLGQITGALGDVFTVHYDLIASSGARTGDALAWVAKMPSAQYDVVVTALGANDVTKGTSLRRFLGQQHALVALLLSRTGARQVIVTGLPPIGEFPAVPQPLRWVLGRQAMRFDRALHHAMQSRTDAELLHFERPLDRDLMASDGFHPGPAAYADWGKKVAARIKARQHTLDAMQDAP